MDNNDGRFAAIIAERLAQGEGRTLGIVTVSGEALQQVWDIQRSFFVAPLDATGAVLADVTAERRRQTQKWGVQSLTWPEWILVLTEEVGEAAQAVNDCHWHGAGIDHLREELLHVAAVAVQIIEAIDADQAEG